VEKYFYGATVLGFELGALNSIGKALLLVPHPQPKWRNTVSLVVLLENYKVCKDNVLLSLSISVNGKKNSRELNKKELKVKI
jgi:hypothetical protein